jgi:hypothetical protein
MTNATRHWPLHFSFDFSNDVRVFWSHYSAVMTIYPPWYVKRCFITEYPSPKVTALSEGGSSILSSFLSYSVIFHKQFYFVASGLKITGHGKPNNLESPSRLKFALVNFLTCSTCILILHFSPHMAQTTLELQYLLRLVALMSKPFTLPTVYIIPKDWNEGAWDFFTGVS